MKYLKRIFLGPIAQLSVVDLLVLAVILNGAWIAFGLGLLLLLGFASS